MAIDTTRIRAILFDYGNTLIPYGRQQVEACDAALAGRLTELFGPVDLAGLARIHEEDRLTPYQKGLAELDLDKMTIRLVRELYGQGRGRIPTADQIAQLRQVRFDAVVRAIEAPDTIYSLLSAKGLGSNSLKIISKTQGSCPEPIVTNCSLSKE